MRQTIHRCACDYTFAGPSEPRNRHPDPSVPLRRLGLSDLRFPQWVPAAPAAESKLAWLPGPGGRGVDWRMLRWVGAERAPECAAGFFPLPLSLTLGGAEEEDRAAAPSSQGAHCPGLLKLCAERGLD